MVPGSEEEDTPEDVGAVDPVAGLMRMQVRVCVVNWFGWFVMKKRRLKMWGQWTL